MYYMKKVGILLTCGSGTGSPGIGIIGRLTNIETDSITIAGLLGSNIL
jgi:hypothetical protein